MGDSRAILSDGEGRGWREMAEEECWDWDWAGRLWDGVAGGGSIDADAKVDADELGAGTEENVDGAVTAPASSAVDEEECSAADDSVDAASNDEDGRGRRALEGGIGGGGCG
jgi:hypothetical protein